MDSLTYVYTHSYISISITITYVCNCNPFLHICIDRGSQIFFLYFHIYIYSFSSAFTYSIFIKFLFKFVCVHDVCTLHTFPSGVAKFFTSFRLFATPLHMLVLFRLLDFCATNRKLWFDILCIHMCGDTRMYGCFDFWCNLLITFLNTTLLKKSFLCQLFFAKKKIFRSKKINWQIEAKFVKP